MVDPKYSNGPFSFYFMEELIKAINTFDYGYEMSDDNRKYDKGIENERLIKDKLKELSFKDRDILEQRLSTFGNTNYIRYFKLNL